MDSPIGLAPVSEQRLRGVPGRWMLYELRGSESAGGGPAEPPVSVADRASTDEPAAADRHRRLASQRHGARIRPR
jgi:hypothetical protein